jgi:hypothetical protein
VFGQETSLSEAGLAIPVYSFDVIVHAGGQLVAAFGAASFDYIAASAGFHAGAEPVNTHSTSNFRLVCSFRHLISSLYV